MDMANGLSIFLSTNSLFIGFCSLMVNLGSRFIIGDITKTQEYLLKHPVVKIIILFCMIFLVTRNVRTSIVITCAFYLTNKALLNENSQFSIIPHFIKNHINNLEENIKKNNARTVGHLENKYQQTEDDLFQDN